VRQVRRECAPAIGSAPPHHYSRRSISPCDEWRYPTWRNKYCTCSNLPSGNCPHRTAHPDGCGSRGRGHSNQRCEHSRPRWRHQELLQHGQRHPSRHRQRRKLPADRDAAEFQPDRPTRTRRSAGSCRSHWSDRTLLAPRLRLRTRPSRFQGRRCTKFSARASRKVTGWWWRPPN
jgi:hypothetical protein